MGKRNKRLEAALSIICCGAGLFALYNALFNGKFFEVAVFVTLADVFAFVMYRWRTREKPSDDDYY